MRKALRIGPQAVVTGDRHAARNAGFRGLAGGIFGGNARSASIAVTTRVARARAVDRRPRIGDPTS